MRVGLAWLLVVPFLVFARPTTTWMLLGSVLAVAGLGFRAWAAGSIDKGSDLATGGPYAYTRNPLYLGSFVIGIGVTAASGAWVWPAIFSVFFAAVYLPTMRQEERELADRFGDRFREYETEVPALTVRLTAYRPDDPGPDAGFAWGRYARYREWEALLGVLAVLTILLLRMLADS